MPKLTLKPGIDAQRTQTQNEGGWWASNLIRWQDGYLQKYGGWLRITSSTVGGTARGIHAYQDTDLNDYILIGSSAGLQIYLSGTLYTLSKFGEGENIEVPWLTSTNGSTTYTVDYTAHGQSVGAIFNNMFPATVSTVTIYNGTYEITEVPNADQFRFVAAGVQATSADTGGEPPLLTSDDVGGGNTLNVFVTLPGHGLSDQYDVFTLQQSVYWATVGSTEQTIPAGEYAARFPITSSTFYINPPYPVQDSTSRYENESTDAAGRIAFAEAWPGTDINWFIGNFGLFAVFCYANGPAMEWSPPIATNLSAVSIPDSPTINAGLLVAMPQAQIICWGSEASGVQDPLLLRWCSAGDKSDWIATSTNQAGSFRLSRGSRIVGAVQASQLTLVWTDIDLWSMQYVGPQSIYSFAIVGQGCGLIAPRAVAVLGNATYWMSQKQFFMFSIGSCQPIVCTVWDFIFDDLDESEIEFIFAGANSQYNEAAWFFRSASTGNIHYVKYNATSQLWDYGTGLDRTAWIDQNVFGPPLAVDSDLIIQQHEIGYDADDGPMEGVYALSGFAKMSEGSDIIYLDEFIPDFKWFGTNGAVSITFWTINYPGDEDDQVMYGPFSITPTTRFIRLDCRGRQLAFRIDWGAREGFSARLGAPTINVKPAGKIP